MDCLIYGGVFLRGRVAVGDWQGIVEGGRIGGLPVVAVTSNSTTVFHDLTNLPSKLDCSRVYWAGRPPELRGLGLWRGGYMTFKDGHFVPDYRHFVNRCVTRVMDSYTTGCGDLRKFNSRGNLFKNQRRFTYYGTFRSDDGIVFYSAKPSELSKEMLETELFMKTWGKNVLLRLYPTREGVYLLREVSGDEADVYLVLSYRRLTDPVSYHLLRGFVLIDPAFRIIYDLYNGVAYSFEKEKELDGTAVGHFEVAFEFGESAIATLL